MVQVRGFLLACPSPLPLGAVVLSTPVSCMQLSALLFFIARSAPFPDALAGSRRIRTFNAMRDIPEV